MFSVPSSTAPAAFIRRTSAASAAAGRALAVDARPGAGRQAGDVEEVLHREGHAGERPERPAGGARGVDRRRLGRAPGRAVTSV